MDNQKLLELYPGYDVVLAPYKRKDDRLHIVLNNSKASKGTKGKTKTISYPKALMESHLGKRLEQNETVHHRDDNFENNDLSNLKIKPRKDHAFTDVIRVEFEKVKCNWCNKKFEMTKHQQNDPRPKFCSKSCAGSYGAAIQNGTIKKKRKRNNKKIYVKYIDD